MGKGKILPCVAIFFHWYVSHGMTGIHDIIIYVMRKELHYKEDDGMAKYNVIKFICLASYLFLLPVTEAISDPVIINNNNTGQAQPPAQSPCNNNSYGTSGNGMPPGTYTMNNSNGTTSTVYTTGDKQPYIVDNNCNQSPVIEPYVNVQPPIGGGPGPNPRPGPRPFK